MNAEQLAALGKNAKAFAQCYVALVEALQAEGVPEKIARQEARATAAMVALLNDGPGPDEPWLTNPGTLSAE